MPKNASHARFWTTVVVAILASVPACADMIRFGFGGSIFGGSTWEIRPDDSVTFAAYQAPDGVTQRPDWVWDNKAMRAGHIRFVLPGAYLATRDIVQRRIGDAKLGPAPAYRSGCLDAGQFVIEVDMPNLTYSAMLDNCIPDARDAPLKVRRHYKALKAMTKEIEGSLKLDALF